jgi:F-type H+-transporting ATPase subunit beta
MDIAHAALTRPQRGSHTNLADMPRSFEEICDGKADDLPEQAFLYVGSIDEVREKAKEMAK